METANHNDNHHHQNLNKVSFAGLLFALSVTSQNICCTGKCDQKPKKNGLIKSSLKNVNRETAAILNPTCSLINQHKSLYITQALRQKLKPI